MADRLLKRLGHHYPMAVVIASRPFGSLGGALVVYYVNLTLSLPDRIRHHWAVLAVVVVAVAVLLTLLLALWETRSLRPVLRRLLRGQPVDQPAALRAGREAVTFAARHHTHEAWLVPCSTLLPVLVFLRLVDGASPQVLLNITIGVFMAIAMAVMAHFFMIERCMQPVIRYLLDQGLVIPFDSLPPSTLRVRLNLCFSLIILTTALMIGTLAQQRAADIIEDPDKDSQREAVKSLRHHTGYITIAAVLLGLVYSTILARSVASRVGRLVWAMRRVEQGHLSERVRPTGTDEIDTLARQFNAMVNQLDQSDHTIRDLNANLENTVRRRTRQLSLSKRELQRSLSQLREHDRLKTEFFANVSHELRTPLTMILSPVRQVLERFGPQLPADATYMLDVVRINGQRLLELINRLLEFSKLEAGQARLRVSAVNLGSVVSRLTTAAQPLAAQRGLRLEVVTDPALPALGADEEKIDTVITNLVSNAIKFTPPGGVVRVETSRHGDRARVAVTDTGIGIPDKDRDRVFERFVQLDGSASREFAGTGLGLALAKDLVELHGGQLNLDSEPGKGSCFWFDLPLAPPPAAPALPTGPAAPTLQSRFSDLVTCADRPEAAAAPAPAVPADAPRILVIDDTPELRALVRGVLAEHYRTLTACDGEEGLQTALRELPDLVISDVMMPGIDGYELCRRLKADPSTARIPFIMLTARAETAMKIEGLDCGADDYLVKPFDAEELRARVRSLLKLRRLNLALDQRNAELESAMKELKATQARLVDAAHRAGMTEIATGVLHNVGNVLNSVTVSVSTLGTRIQNLKLEGPSKAAGLLRENSERLPEFLSSDPLGKRLPDYLAQLSSMLLLEQKQLLDELDFLKEKLQDIRTIIQAQQKYAKQISFKETADLQGIVEDVLAMHRYSLLKYGIELVRDFDPIPAASLEKLKLVQVIDNLVRNAVESMKTREAAGHTLVVKIKRAAPDRVRLTVSDTGRGIARDDLQRIFNYGFTTKQTGNGFGLHSAANAMTEMGGNIKAQSDGIDHGATFTIEFPLEITATQSNAITAQPAYT